MTIGYVGYGRPLRTSSTRTSRIIVAKAAAAASARIPTRAALLPRPHPARTRPASAASRHGTTEDTHPWP